MMIKYFKLKTKDAIKNLDRTQNVVQQLLKKNKNKKFQLGKLTKIKNLNYKKTVFSVCNGKKLVFC